MINLTTVLVLRLVSQVEVKKQFGTPLLLELLAEPRNMQSDLESQLLERLKLVEARVAELENGQRNLQQAYGSSRLRLRLEEGLRHGLPGLHLYGEQAARLSNTCCVRFGDLDSELVLGRLERAGVVASKSAPSKESKRTRRSSRLPATIRTPALPLALFCSLIRVSIARRAGAGARRARADV